MFSFFGAIGTYEQRRVDRYEKGGLMISTASMPDSEKPFETAVAHPEYNEGKIIIVEEYDTKKEAQEGHNRWVKTMTHKKLPVQLKDVSSAGIALLSNAIGGERAYKRKRSN